MFCLLFCQEPSESHNICVNLFLLDCNAVACHYERLVGRLFRKKKVWEERNTGSISIEVVCLGQFTSGRSGYASGSVDMKLRDTRVEFGA